jgi:hypothetical protein
MNVISQGMNWFTNKFENRHELYKDFKVMGYNFSSIKLHQLKVSDASFQLKLQAQIDKWDEAIPLGNGLTGGLLWGEGNEIRLSLDRGDIWDNRAHPGFTAPGFTYDVVREMANSGKTDLLNKQVVANRRLREGKY